MIRKMIVISKAAEGIQSHLSKRTSSSYRRESHQTFEENIINHLEVTGNPSFRSDGHRHFEQTANPSFRRDSTGIISKR